MPLRRFRSLNILAAISVLTLLIFSPQLFSNTEIASATTSIQSANSYSNHALTSMSNNSTINLHLLKSFTNGNLTVRQFELVIQKLLLPPNIRKVLLDIGWQNYSVGSVPYETWINNWLTASDVLGIQNVFYLGQFTNAGVGSPWIESLLNIDPAARTYFANGRPANYLSMDDPDVSNAVEEDLINLYSYYGNHGSWVGIGTGSPSSDPYYSNNSLMPQLGYSNSTLENFANSVYFQRDLNGSGYLPNGSLDKLWESFRSAVPAIQVSSGNWMTSSGNSVYGTATNRHELSMVFYVSRNESELQVLWYGSKHGSPGDLNATIFAGQSESSGEVMVSSSVQSSTSISNTTNWQQLEFTGDFSPGYYNILFSSPLGDSQNYYSIYDRNYELPNQTAQYILPPNQGSIGGSTILWIKNPAGADLEIYPYENV
ncbi:MAG: hypothetical protein ACRDF4_06035, partial [Rhabdochlamydiaceae bacterium]